MPDRSIYIPKPIVAFRSWRIFEDRLQPLHRSYICDQTPWKPRGIAVATCVRGHVAPASGCRCGLYGNYELEPDAVAQATISGAFVAFGDVALHGRGLRAGKARIVGLVRGDEHHEEAKKIADLYELPLFDDLPKLKEWAENWGELREPTEKAGMNMWTASRAAANFLSGAAGLMSSYRTPQEQAKIAAEAGRPGTSHHGPPYASPIPLGYASRRRVVLKLELGPNAQIEHWEHPGGGMRTRLKGLPDCWVLRSAEEQIERVEIPRPGFHRVGMMPGLRRILLEIEADFSNLEEAKKAIDEIQAKGLGRPLAVYENTIV